MTLPDPPAVAQDIHDVVIDDIAFGGEGIARIDGRVVFVDGVIPGERVRIALVASKKGYARAELLDVLEASPHRVTPPCPYVGPCSGCGWQHIAYEEQLRLKQHIVSEQLRRIGKFEHPNVLPTIGMDEPWAYRNHARFSVGRTWHDIGFVRKGSHQLVQIDRCMIMAEPINEVLAHFQKRFPSTAMNVRVGIATGDRMVQPGVDDPAIATGQTEYHEELGGHRFQISAPSFFQTNTTQAEVLVRLVLDALELRGDEAVADVYAGVGTFAALLAPRVRAVYYIEESGPAYRDAMVNLGGFVNIELIPGKAEERFGSLPETPDVVVLDPPRAGCHPALLDALITTKPKTIAYVSCDPSTLARDLSVLHGAGWQVGPVQPVDLFPHTFHVESVVILRRDDG